MPVWRNPVSAPARAFMPSHRRQDLQGEGDLGEIAPHLAAPAPIAARLLARDPAFLAECHRHAALGEKERGRGADDAAADDDDIGLSRQLCCGADGIDAG